MFARATERGRQLMRMTLTASRPLTEYRRLAHSRDKDIENESSRVQARPNNDRHAWSRQVERTARDHTDHPRRPAPPTHRLQLAWRGEKLGAINGVVAVPLIAVITNLLQLLVPSYLPGDPFFSPQVRISSPFPSLSTQKMHSKISNGRL